MKQLIKIFPGTDSHSKAAGEVEKLLHGVFKTEVDNGHISIEKCTDTKEARVNYQTKTAVLVVAAEQISDLHRPTQQDDPVNLWAELQNVLEHTKPEGSIIVVIYGDDSSSDIEEDKVLHEKWHRVFMFHNEHAEYPLLQDRCFSLSRDFNDLQKRKLRNYMNEIAFFPTPNSSHNVFVIGSDKHMQRFREDLSCHPFLLLRSQFSETSKKVSVDDLFRPSHRGPAGGTSSMSLYYFNEVTNSIIRQEVNENARNKPSGKWKTWEVLSGATYTIWNYIYGLYKDYRSGSTLPKFDRILLLCAEASSFQEVYSHQQSLSLYVMQQFRIESKSTNMPLEVLPVLVGDKPQTEEDKNSMIAIMKKLIKRGHRENYDDLADILECHRRDDKWLLHMYIMHLCHAGYQQEVKQLIKIFSKLESYSAAHQEVERLLNDVFNEETEEGKLFIEKYTDSAMASTLNYKTETVVAVLDARQTRVLITPRRRDAAVDQWNELQGLAHKSKPKGSIIIVIYGDENSRALKEDQILHDTWHRVFKFNDEHAEYPLLQYRCFSLWKEFSDFQKRKLRNHMNEVALFPPFESMSDVLVVGNHDQIETFRKYLRRHPFLHLRPLHCEERQGVTADELFKPSYETAVDGKSILRVYYYNTVANLPVKVCKRCTVETFGKQHHTEDVWEEVDGWLQLRPASSEVDGQTPGIVNRSVIMISKFASTAWSYIDSLLLKAGRHTLPVFDRVILLCHDCDTCFQQIYNRRNLVSDCAAECLESKCLHACPDVLPLALGDRSKTKQEKDTMLEIMAKFSRYDNPEVFNMIRNDSSLLENDDEWLTKMYIMYLCHSVFPYIPGDDAFVPIKSAEDDDMNLQSSTDRKDEIIRRIQEAILDILPN